MKYKLFCDACGEAFPPESGLYTCKNCQSRLRVEYTDQKVDFSSHERLPGIFRFLKKLPLEEESFISMGEGLTPAVPLEDELSADVKVWVKNESLNPTGTYKDRPAAVAVSKARELGAKGVIVASDGNAAPAVAAYAARGGLACVVLMPVNTPELRYLQAKAYGSRIFLVEGNINDCLDMAAEIASETEYHNCCTANKVNPYQIEGNKTIAFEIADQFKELPDWVIVPVGGAGLMSAVAKGFEELKKGEVAGRIPRILAVQASNCAPFVEAFLKNEVVVKKLKDVKESIALTIALPYPPDGDMALEYLRENGGSAVAVTEEEIMAAVLRLSSRHGILSEPSGAVSFAGLKKAFSRGIIRPGEKCLAVVTGTGLKTIDFFRGSGGKNIKTVSKNTKQVLAHLK